MQKNNQTCLIGKFGIGLLGTSSKYKAQSDEEIFNLINFIVDNYESYIDTSTVYGHSKNSVNHILSKIIQTKSTKTTIINKYGLDLDPSIQDYSALIKDFENSLSMFKNNKVFHFLHRASFETFERDLNFFNAIKKNFPDTIFGICTNNLDIFNLYSSQMEINILQIAVNLLDYKNNIPLLKLAKKLGCITQARSCLSSGLLNLNYNENSYLNFTDSIRSRFGSNSQNIQKYKNRINNRNKIYNFFLEKKLDKNMTFTNFCYSILLESSYIDSVILGGSNKTQLEQNSKIKLNSFNKIIIDSVYNKKILEWSSDYL